MRIRREGILYVLAGLLTAAVCLLAVYGAPELSPVTLQEEESVPEPAASGVLLDLNRATEYELTRLPGIGEARARAIVEYRESCGGFYAVEELCEVKGISESLMEELRPYVTVNR